MPAPTRGDAYWACSARFDASHAMHAELAVAGEKRDFLLRPVAFPMIRHDGVAPAYQKRFEFQHHLPKRGAVIE